MRLHYYKSRNFGDALNAWLWPKLIGPLLDDAPDSILVGIGTILDPDIPPRPHKFILSSGTGYRTPPDVHGDDWTVLAVRGPLTARMLGLPQSVAVTDGALLLRQCEFEPVELCLGPAFMPHCSSVTYFDWDTYCRQIGYRFIDPTGPVERIIEAIRSSSVVVCEAMHGAIVADTFRVPWVPVRLYKQVNTFKWSDWFLSLSLSGHLISVPPLFAAFAAERGHSAPWVDGTGILGKLRRLPNHVEWTWRRLTRRARDRSTRAEVERMFMRFAAGEGALLSNEQLQEHRLSQLIECVDRLRSFASAHAAEGVS